MFTAGFDSKNRGGRQSGAGLQVRGGSVESWFAVLPDWRLAVVWLATIVLGTVIHFFPIARLLDSLTQ